MCLRQVRPRPPPVTRLMTTSSRIIFMFRCQGEWPGDPLWGPKVCAPACCCCRRHYLEMVGGLEHTFDVLTARELLARPVLRLVPTHIPQAMLQRTSRRHVNAAAARALLPLRYSNPVHPRCAPTKNRLFSWDGGIWRFGGAGPRTV